MNLLVSRGWSILLGVVWSLFSYCLFAYGQKPSAPISLFGDEQYFAQATYLWLLVPLTAFCADWVVERFFKVKRFACSWAFSTLMLSVIPEFVVTLSLKHLPSMAFVIGFLCAHAMTIALVFKRNPESSFKNKALALFCAFSIIGLVFAIFVR